MEKTGDKNINKKEPNGTFGYAMSQGLFFMTMHAIMGMAVVYLQGAGFSKSFIGVAIAICSLVSAVLVIPIGSITDKSKRFDVHHVLMLSVALIAASAAFLMAGVKAGVIVIILFGFMMIAVQINNPLLNALGMFFENRGVYINYGVARGVGSGLYALASIVISYLASEKMMGLVAVPISIFVLNVALFLVLMFFGNVRKFNSDGEIINKRSVSADEDTEPGAAQENSLGTLGFMKKYPWYMFFIVAVAVIFIPHNTLCNYMIVVLEPMGGDVSSLGWVLAIAAVCEIPTMFLFSKLKERFRSGSLIIFSGVFFTIKTVATLLAFLSGSIPLLCAVQVLQGLGYAVIIPASVYFGNESVDKANEVQSQSFIGFAITVGTVLGSVCGGYLSDHLSVSAMLGIISAISTVGSVLLFLSVKMCEKHTVRD